MTDDEPKGLYDKYEVLKDGEPIDGRAFVLRPDRDPSARVALAAYAESTDDGALRWDLYSLLVGDLPLRRPGGER